MTYKEAIRTLKDLRIFDDDCETDCEAIDIAIETLAKQIPQKIKKQQWMDTKCECGYCFSKDYEDGYYSIPRENMTKFCPNCGRKLDWREDDEQ